MLPHDVLFASAALWRGRVASRSAPPSWATASGRTSTGTPRCGTTVSSPRQPVPSPCSHSVAGYEVTPGEGGGASRAPPVTAGVPGELSAQEAGGQPRPRFVRAVRVFLRTGHSFNAVVGAAGAGAPPSPPCFPAGGSRRVPPHRARPRTTPAKKNLR